MPCRTCLGTLDPDSSVRLTTVLPIGKSIQEILLFFIPKMVESKFDDCLMCSKCVDTLQVFTNFISKVISIEKYLTKEFIKQEQIQNVFEDHEKDERNTQILKSPALSSLLQPPTENEILSDKLEIHDDPILDVNEETIGSQTIKLFDNHMETDEPVVNEETNIKESEIDVTVPEAVPQYNVIHINSLDSETGMPAVLPLSTFLGSSKSHYSQVISITKQKEDVSDILNRLSRSEIDLLESDMSQKGKRRRILFLSSSMDEYERMLLKKCPVCGGYFRTGKSLENHLVKHKNYNAFKCQLCSTTFKKMFTYNKHLRNYNIYKDCSIRVCTMCKKVMSEKVFDTHMEIHKTKECKLCDKKFITAFGLAKHGMRHEARRKEELCSICGKLIKAGGLLPHMRTHSEEHPYLCQKCPKAFKLAVALKKHEDIVHNSVLVECTICNKKLTKHGMHAHMSLKHSDKPPSHKCHICDKEFMRPDYYRKHMISHTFLKAGRKRSKYRVSGNLKPTDADEERNFACKYCERKYHNIYQLRVHLLSSHLKMGDRPKCKICNMTFRDKTNLTRHEKKHDDPDFDLMCKVCWNKFGSKEKLEVHLLKHKNSRKHKCPECGEFFPSKYLLYHHKNEKHFDEELLNQRKAALLEDGLSEFRAME